MKRRNLCGLRRFAFEADVWLFAGGVFGGGGGGFGVGEGLIDELEELAAVDDFDEGRALAVGGGDPDGGGVFDADALAESVVSLDLCGELALGVHGKGKGDAVSLRELLRELV